MPVCPPETPAGQPVDHISLGRRSVRGTVWTVIGNGVSQAVLLFSHVVCARMMGREGYGEFGAVTSTTATVGLLAGLGLSLTATKYISELRISDPVRAKRILVLAERMTLASGLMMALVLGLLSARFRFPEPLYCLRACTPSRAPCSRRSNGSGNPPCCPR
jgi:O-antigen/teichoic acid export membrane protein